MLQRLQGGPHIVELLGIFDDKRTGKIYLVTENLEYSAQDWLKVRRLHSLYGYMIMIMMLTFPQSLNK